MKHRLLFLLPLIGLLAPLAAQGKEPVYPPQKVVYHINYHETKRIDETFVNISNHLEAVGEDSITLKAVVHGPSIEYFMAANDDEDKQMALDSLRMSGVQFLICGNTLTGYNSHYNELYEVEEEDVVKAGLPELVHLQQQGYIYVRP